MKSKIELNVTVDDEQWTENTDFDAVKVAEELRDLAFAYVADACEHELLALDKTYEVNVCLSNDAEVQRLNKEFRGKDKPTNVLSFACIDDDEFWDMLDKSADMELGDIILAFETLQREADEKRITVYAHYCHLLVHGFLHILGFDHQTDEEADEMESLETEILEQFSIDNPYQDAAEYKDNGGKCGRENGSRESCCPGSNGDGSFDARESGGENNGRSGQENSDRPVWRKWFGTAYVFGFSFYAVGFSWISNALLIDGNKFAAFIPAVFASTGLFFGLFWAVPAALAAGGRNVYARALLFCAWFVFFEWVRSFIFTGFPWNLLGTALAFDVRAIQGAAYIGTYGLSLLLLLMSCGAAILVSGAFQKRFYGGALWFILLPAGFLLWAAGQYEKTEPGTTVVRLVQPSIPQTFKWEPGLAYRNFRKYIDLSKSRPSDGVKLVVWGETASPYFLDRDEEHLAEITEAVPDG